MMNQLLIMNNQENENHCRVRSLAWMRAIDLECDAQLAQWPLQRHKNHQEITDQYKNNN